MMPPSEIALAPGIGVVDGEAVVSFFAGVAAHEDPMQELMKGDICHHAHAEDEHPQGPVFAAQLQEALPLEQEEQSQQQDHEAHGQAVDDPEMALVVLQVDDEFL